jgi:hypothetical protein
VAAAAVVADITAVWRHLLQMRARAAARVQVAVRAALAVVRVAGLMAEPAVALVAVLAVALTAEPVVVLAVALVAEPVVALAAEPVVVLAVALVAELAVALAAEPVAELAVALAVALAVEPVVVLAVVLVAVLVRQPPHWSRARLQAGWAPQSVTSARLSATLARHSMGSLSSVLRLAA